MQDQARDDDLVMNLVDLALAKPPEERESYLRTACSGDLELFRQAWSYVEWDERMQGFLLEPLYQPLAVEHPFGEGDLLVGRFRIEREIAQGGMGVVYEAWDERLERRIAIKCAKTGFRRRLPPEVRHAREIAHPNVCKIFEIHTAQTSSGDIDFVTMEYLEGETLAERFQRGPVPRPEAVRIARQLCAGLSAAHHQGIIHGDLKSGNVILAKAADGSIRAVITDFGMARGPDSMQTTAQSGARGGTPDYMAPELWKGEQATLASDVYALGVMLTELATGQKPSPDASRPAYPKWNTILTRCLAADPAARYASAEQVAKALEPSPTPAWVLIAAAVLLVAAPMAVVIYRYATASRESVRLALLPFESDRDTASLAGGLFGDTAGQLARLKGGARTSLTFVPPGKTLRDRVDTADKALTMLRATHVLHATLTREDGKLVVHAYLTDARSRVNVRDWRVEYASGQLKYVPVALAGMVTATLRLPPLAAAAAVNAAAAQDYWNGLYYLRRNSGVDTALQLLQEAVAVDPDSPLTHAALAEAQQLKFFLNGDTMWLERAKESARQAEARNPDLEQVHLVAGVLSYREGLYELAAAECLRAVELDPQDGDAYRRLGQAYEASNLLDQALEAYRRAVEKRPLDYRNHQQLGSFYYQRGDYPQALPHFLKTVELASEEPTTHFVLGQEYLGLGQLPEAERELRLSIHLGETPAELHTLGVVLMDEGDYGEAEASILKAVKLGPERLIWWMNLGTLYHLMKQKSQSDYAYRRALDLAEIEMKRDPRNGKTRSYLSFVCARLGETKRAESEIAQARAMSPNDASVRFMAVATYEALGRRDETLSLLNSFSYPELGDLSRWPDLAELSHSPRFLQLLASHQTK